jgi:uroporphyrinogen-III synthase
MRLLLTRPQPDAEHTAAALRMCGHDVIVAPLLRIETMADADLGGGPWAAILVTSANAARAIAAHRRFAELLAVPVLAVSERSAQAMRAIGFADVSSAGGDVGDLTRVAAARLKRGAPLLYLAAADRSGDVAGALAAHDFVVRTAVVYRAAAVATLPTAAAEALRSTLDGVLHFSRRSAEVYMDATREAGLYGPALNGLAHFCLSAQVGKPLIEAGAADVRIAEEPSEVALVELVSVA